MNERNFRIVLGAILLIALYFELRLVVYGYMAILLFEAITNWRIPLLVSRLRGIPGDTGPTYAASPSALFTINFEAERALRLAVVGFLVISYVLFNDALWFFPWFIGFALFGAGLSGMCPMVMGFRRLGFK